MFRVGKLVARVTVLALLATPVAAYALDVKVAGTFKMNYVQGNPGADLAGIVGHNNAYEAVLYDVTFACVEEPFPPRDIITEMHAASFTFSFLGDDAALLKERVGRYFCCGAGSPPDVFISVYSNPMDGEFLIFSMFPSEVSAVHLSVDASPPAGGFLHDRSGCPVLSTYQSANATVILFDQRPGNHGNVIDANSKTTEITLLYPPTATGSTSWGAIKGLYR